MEDLFSEYLKSKPERLCRHCGKCNGKFPSSPWDKLPEGCGYEGWAFKVREEIKQKVRRQKEALISLEISLKNEPFDKKIKEDIEKIKKNIEIYAKYGSSDW